MLYYNHRKGRKTHQTGKGKTMRKVTINEYYNKRGEYMGEKNAETEKKAARYGWTLETKTVIYLNAKEGFAEEAALRKVDVNAAKWENANTVR
jgi:hypothetical protein